MVTFLNIFKTINSRFKLRNQLGMINGNANKSGDILPQLACIENGGIPAYDSALLQFLNPLNDGWSRQPHAFANFHQWQFAIFLENREDMPI